MARGGGKKMIDGRFALLVILMTYYSVQTSVRKFGRFKTTLCDRGAAVRPTDSMGFAS